MERLAWRTIAETKDGTNEEFNPTLLHDSFVQAIKYNLFSCFMLQYNAVLNCRDLTLLQERQQKKCERLEARVQDDEALFRKEIHSLQDSNKVGMMKVEVMHIVAKYYSLYVQVAVDMFQDLDEKINIVAAKVLHLGDQLDSINGPRSRVVEAQRLMTHLNEFLKPRSFSSSSISLFSDQSKVYSNSSIF